MDLFGIKKRRAEREAEEKRIAEEKAAARQALLDSRQKLIDGWLKANSERLKAEARELWAKDLEQVKELNQVCPVCGSRNRIHKFVRTKGELNGESHSNFYGGGNFLGSSLVGHGSGKIHGELDTLQVNECKDCGNQWAVVEPKHKHVSDYVQNYHSPYDDGRIDSLYRRIRDVVKDGKWPKEHVYHFLKPFHDTPRMVLEFLIAVHFWSWCGPAWYELDDWSTATKAQIFGTDCCKEGVEEHYLYQFSEKVWDIVKRLLKREEYENTEYPQSK